MAGQELALSSTSSDLENTTRKSQISSVIDQWEVQYSRFVRYSSYTSRPFHPSLSPPKLKRRLTGGNWISASVVSLKLEYLRSSPDACDAVIIIFLRFRVLEEHYVSKMNFSWPQVSCISGFPARGSRTVIVSYKDGVGQIQKFTLRFSIIRDAERFMALVKEIMETGKTELLVGPVFESKVPSHNEVISSSDGPAHSHEVDQEWKAATVNYTQVMLPRCMLNEAQDSESHNRIEDFEATKELPVLPPSFSQLMKNCCPTVSEEKPIEVEGDLRTQFMRYLEGTSFTDLLATVEDVVSVLEGDIVL